MPTNQSNLINYLYIAVKWRKLIITNGLIIAIFAAALSLVVPVWFKGVSKILPPSSESTLSSFASIMTQIPMPGNLFGFGTNQNIMTAIAILESRTMMESVVTEFNLIERYNVKDIEKAVKILRTRCSFTIDEESTITVTVLAKSKFFNSKAQVREARLLSKDITNYFVEQLDLLNKALMTEKARNIRTFLEERVEFNKDDLEKAENELKQFQEKHGIILLPEQTVAAINVAASIQAEAITKQIEIGVLQKSIGKDNPNYKQKKNELTEINIALSQLNKGDNKKEHNIFPLFDNLPEYGVIYARLLRKITIQELLLEFLLPQFEQAKIQEAKNIPTIQIIDKAVLPVKKAKPQRAIIVIFSVFTSVILTFFYIMAIEKIKKLESENNPEYKKFTWIISELKNDFRKYFLRKKHFK